MEYGPLVTRLCEPRTATSYKKNLFSVLKHQTRTTAETSVARAAMANDGWREVIWVTLDVWGQRDVYAAAGDADKASRYAVLKVTRNSLANTRQTIVWMHVSSLSPMRERSTPDGTLEDQAMYRTNLSKNWPVAILSLGGAAEFGGVCAT